MYWYLSFLRPPPVSVSATAGSITITPQIANDLRTELRYDPIDISYIWQRVHPVVDPPIASQSLTTWSPPASTYLPITIPLPLSVPGEKWRLGLFAMSHDGPSSITASLLDYTAHPGVISVWSEPILIIREPGTTSGPIRGVGGKGKKDKVQTAPAKGHGKKDEGPKQGRITREWTMGEGRLRVIEQTSFDLDKKIWDSGLALSSWFLRYLCEAHSDSRARDILHQIEKGKSKEGDLRILELGSGTGLVSVALALALRQRQNKDLQVDITATDLDSAIELMDENIRLNDLATDAEDQPSPHVPVNAEVLDWDQPLPPWVSPDAWPDLIVAADITYNTSAFPSLLKTLASLLEPPHLRFVPRDRPTLLLAYKQRDPGERELWSLLKDKGVVLDKVDTIQGSEEDGAVEIWIGGKRS